MYVSDMQAMAEEPYINEIVYRGIDMLLQEMDSWRIFFR